MNSILELSMYVAVQQGAHHAIAKANGNDLFIFWHDEFPKFITAFKIDKEDEIMKCMAAMRYSEKSWYLDEDDVRYDVDSVIWYDGTDLHDVYGEMLEIHGELYGQSIKFTYSNQEAVLDVNMKHIRRLDSIVDGFMGYIIKDDYDESVAKLVSLRGVKRTSLYKKNKVFKAIYDLLVTR